MRFLLVLSWLELGGAERQAINFAEYLWEHHHEVTVLGLGKRGQVCDICETKGIRCMSLVPHNDLYTIRYKILHKMHIRRLTNEEIALKGLIHDLTDHINQNGYDVAISYCALANTVLGCAKPGCGRTVCIWYQRDGGVYDNIGGLQCHSIEKMDGIIANGQAGVECLRRNYGKEALLIYNGIKPLSPVMDRDSWRKKLNVSDTDIVCTMVAQLTHDSKDHMTILKAWSKLISTDDRYYFIMAGRFANAYDELQGYVESMGLTENIRFLGHIDDVYGLLQASDICIFSSRTEGSPNGVLEGCMCGLPVVATDIPELREAISAENYPYLFQPGDSERAAELIGKMADDADLRSRIGESNKNKVIDLFDPDRNYSEIVRVAEDLVG